MELISVIVPVYNVEKYLDQCIRSLVNQTYKKLEIILVDDGSTDQSGRICDHWKEVDSRIRVLHLSNGGAGRARNKGVEIARGTVFSFIDSDDYVVEHFYEILMEALEKNDIAECDYIITSKSTYEFDEEIYVQNKECFTREQAMGLHIEEKKFKQVVWNKIYRRNVIEQIYFPEGKMIDDEFWTYRVIGNASGLVHIDNKMYAYRQHGESVIHNMYSVRRLQALEAKRERADYIIKNFATLKNLSEIDYWLSCLFQGQMIIKYLKGKERTSALDKLKQHWKKNRISLKMIKLLAVDYKIWALGSKISITLICRLRNVLRIGL